jgi:hypothetical protein
MSGEAAQHTAAASEESLEPAIHRWHRLRWFLSEFLVIVAGVLVALAVNAWWQGRQDRQVEIAYLQQLQLDLDASNQTLDETYRLVQGMAEASASISHEFWRRDGRTDTELRKLLAEPLRSKRVLPVLGTARSLIASGDLRLVQSASLRSAIPRYVDAMDADVSDIARYDETYYRTGVNQAAQLFDGSALVAGAAPLRDANFSTDFRPDATTPPPFPIDVDALLKDPDVYRAYANLLIGHRGQAGRYRDMHEATAALRKEVSDALADLQRMQ